MGRFGVPERLVQRGFIHLYPEARRVRQEYLVPPEFRLDGEYLLVVKTLLFGRRLPYFKPREVGYGSCEVGGCGDADRPERIVGHEVDVVRLGPAPQPS